ncbi:hypothetical protein [Clostridium merdae]|uniref:hypothetical protein n=1 Tax=Clostridium merdae TaxID=1958780 RepID=UPI000A270D84|nr:hypothetical protein [Clostridium merdae]
MSNIVIEITAPEIVTAIQQLAAVLAPRKIQPDILSLPQPLAEQATSTQLIPVQPEVPSPMQPYQPAVPISPTQAAPMPSSPMMDVANTAPVVTPAPVYSAPIALSTNQTLSIPVAGAPTAMPDSQTPVAPIAAAPAYQIDDLARGAAQLMDAGKHQECRALLTQFQVRGLGDLKPEQFGAFATCLRQMGAKL